MSDPQPSLFDGRYSLIEVVGEGGMAEVWRADDTVLGRQVAIKILRPQFASDPEFLERFQSEGRAAAGLNDPGIVSVYDVGRDKERPYLVMEYIAGADLKETTRQTPLDVAAAVRIAAAVARAVGRAHAAGLVHRDIKPQNVLIASDGRVKVTDFGIARALAVAGTTAPGIVMGTVHYLSPEQASGGSASTASDVYSLGVLLYEMLAGRLPHEAESSVGVAVKIANEDPPAVDSVAQNVPAALAGIVAKAMARDTEQRYPDANALADALDGYALWSEQRTSGIGAVTKTAGSEAPRLLLPKTADAGPAPLFDAGGLVLAIVALLAVAGLIPLWTAVRNSAEPGALQARFGIVPPTATPTPTALPPVGDAGQPLPDLRGLEADAAARRLRGLGLGVSLETRASVTSTAGVVLMHSPGASDELLPPGTVVRLVVSGEPLVAVPSAEGTYDLVAQAILGVGLEPVRRDRWGGSSSPTGVVMGLEPPGGTPLSRGSPVQVTVNSGAWLPLGVDFEDHLHLAGVDLPTNRLRPADSLSLVARWEATGTISGTYRTVAELIGANGTVSRDAHAPPPRPTNTWAPGEQFLGDSFLLPLPADLAPGTYSLVIGVERDDPSGARLGIAGVGGGVGVQDDRVVVMAIEVN